MTQEEAQQIQKLLEAERQVIRTIVREELGAVRTDAAQLQRTMDQLEGNMTSLEHKMDAGFSEIRELIVREVRDLSDNLHEVMDKLPNKIKRHDQHLGVTQDEIMSRICWKLISPVDCRSDPLMRSAC